MTDGETVWAGNITNSDIPIGKENTARINAVISSQNNNTKMMTHLQQKLRINYHWAGEDPKEELLWWHHHKLWFSLLLACLLLKLTPPFASIPLVYHDKNMTNKKQQNTPFRIVTRPFKCISIKQLQSLHNRFNVDVKISGLL